MVNSFSYKVVHKWRHGFSGRGCQGFCDNSTKALVMKKRDNWGGGVNNTSNMRDVIYGWTLFKYFFEVDSIPQYSVGSH
jgi:hypothetical protein